MKVVFDTKAFVPALTLRGGRGDQALSKIIEGEDSLAISKSTIDESSPSSPASSAGSGESSPRLRSSYPTSSSTTPGELLMRCLTEITPSWIHGLRVRAERSGFSGAGQSMLAQHPDPLHGRVNVGIRLR